MSGFLKFLFLCLLAVAAGIAAVSIPIEGRTVAEHVRSLVEEATGSQSPPARRAEAKRPEGKAPPRMARQRSSEPARENPPADHPSEEERRALEELIGSKVR